MTNEEFIKSISLVGEEWKNIIGYENRYIVSNYGRIASLSSSYEISPYGKRRVLHKKPNLLKPTMFSNGYLYVMFRKNGKRFKYTVHRLVAIAFLENPNNFPQIDHIDGNRQNNAVENLKWCTAKVNMSNPITQKRVDKGRASVNFPYRLKVVQLLGDDAIAVYDSIYSTKEFNFNPSLVNRCCNGFKRSHRGYRWMKLSDYEKIIGFPIA